MLYNMAAPRKELRLYLFGERPRNYTVDVMKTIVGIFKTYGISSFNVLITDTRIQIIDLETSEVSNQVIERKCDEPLQILSVYEKAELDALLESRQTDHVIDIDVVSKWLNVRKDSIVTTLYASYKKDIDYVTKALPKKPPGSRHGGHNRMLIFLTPDCAKRISIRSRAASKGPTTFKTPPLGLGTGSKWAEPLPDEQTVG